MNIHLFFFKDLIYFILKRGCTQASGRRSRGGVGRISGRLHAQCRALLGAPFHVRSWMEPKPRVRDLINWATQGPLQGSSFVTQVELPVCSYQPFAGALWRWYVFRLGINIYLMSLLDEIEYGNIQTEQF